MLKRLALTFLTLSFFSLSLQAQRSSSLGSVQTLNGASSAVVRIYDVDDTHVIAIYKLGTGGSHDLYARVGEVNSAAQTISWGTAQLIESSNNLSISLAVLSSTTAVIFYELTDDEEGVARVLTIDTSDESIGVGATNVYAGNIDRAGTFIEQQAARLSGTSVAIGYVDDGNSDHLTVKVGTVDGTTITFGSAYEVSTNANANHPSMTAMSHARLAFSWEDDNNSQRGTVRVGEIDGTVVSMGTEVTFTSTAIGYNAIVGISETQFVVAYEDDATSGDPGEAYVGTVDGTTITLSTSSYQFEDTPDVVDINIDHIHENEFVIGWNSGSNTDAVYRVGEVSGTGTSASIAYATAVSVTSGTEGDDSWVSNVGPNTVVMAYTDDQDADHLEVRVGTLTPSLTAAREATVGPIDIFKDALTSTVRSTRLSDDKVLITWLDATSSSANNLKAVVGTVSGTDIAYGDEVTVNSNIYTTSQDLTAFSSTQAVVIYEARLTTDEAKYSVLDIDGTDITVTTGTFADGPQFGAGATVRNAALDNGTVVVSYEEDLGSDLFKIVAGTLSGSTISWGTPVSPNSDDASNADVVALSDSKFAVVYEDNRSGANNGAEGMIVVGTVASNTITLGTAEAFEDSQAVITTRAAALSETELIIVYEADVSVDYAIVTYVTVSGTDIVFPGGISPSFYTTEAVDDIGIDVLSPTEFMIGIDGGADDNSGVYTGVVNSNDISLTSEANIYNGQADDIEINALTSDVVVVVFTNDSFSGGSSTTDRGDALVVTLDATTNPEINVQGNSINIVSGDNSPTTTDHTDFGTGASLSRTFTIQNQGTGTLTLGSNAVTITGTNAADFSVNTQPSTSVSVNGSTTFIIDFSSAVASTRTAEIHINSDDIHESDYVFSIEAIGGTSAPTSVTVAATVFLEGAWNGSSLNTTINSSIPSSQPYSGSTFNSHGGSESASAPAMAVDWVLVELREAGSAATATNSTKKGSAAGFLMSDGTIKATDGTSDLTVALSGNSGADFYVVIYHRNHLPIMSANAISESSGTYTIDFTSDSNNTYQTTTALVSLSGSKFGMPAGDLDQDGDIDATDLSTWRSNNGVAFSYGTNGEADLNLDGVINAVDRNDFHQKNTSKTRQVPGS